MEQTSISEQKEENSSYKPWKVIGMWGNLSGIVKTIPAWLWCMCHVYIDICNAVIVALLSVNHQSTLCRSHAVGFHKGSWNEGTKMSALLPRYFPWSKMYVCWYCLKSCLFSIPNHYSHVLNLYSSSGQKPRNRKFTVAIQIWLLPWLRGLSCPLRICNLRSLESHGF